MTDPKTDPTTFGLLTYAWVFGLSIFGGVASFVSKLNSGAVRAFNITELLGEMLISAFAGVTTFYLCQWAGIDEMLTAALVGLCGHMGSRSIALAEDKLKAWADKRTGG